MQVFSHTNQSLFAERTALETLIPELKESEDEKIRNRILLSLEKDLMATKNSGCDTQDLEQCIAWLEKQSESDETKATMFLINKGYPVDANGTFPTYEELYNIIREGLEEQAEQKSAEWSEEDDAYKELAICAVANFYDEENPLNKCIVNWLKSLKDKIKEK